MTERPTSHHGTTRDGAAATVPTTRTPGTGGGLAEVAAAVAVLAVVVPAVVVAAAGVADAITAAASAVTHRSQLRTRRPRCARDTVG